MRAHAQRSCLRMFAASCLLMDFLLRGGGAIFHLIRLPTTPPHLQSAPMLHNPVAWNASACLTLSSRVPSGREMRAAAGVRAGGKSGARGPVVGCWLRVARQGRATCTVLPQPNRRGIWLRCAGVPISLRANLPASALASLLAPGAKRHVYYGSLTENLDDLQGHPIPSISSSASGVVPRS